MRKDPTRNTRQTHHRAAAKAMMSDLRDAGQIELGSAGNPMNGSCTVACNGV